MTRTSAFQPVYYMYVCLYQWLGEQGVMLYSLIKLENGPSKSMWDDKKWAIENFKIIEKNWKWAIDKNLFPITALFCYLLEIKWISLWH